MKRSFIGKYNINIKLDKIKQYLDGFLNNTEKSVTNSPKLKSTKHFLGFGYNVLKNTQGSIYLPLYVKFPPL